MENLVPKNQLRKVFVEALNGYSSEEIPKFGKVYIKHMDYFTSQDIDEKKDYYMDVAVKKGLPTTKQKEKEIIDNKLWDTAKDKKIEELAEFLRGLNSAKSKYLLKADIDRSKAEIERTEKEINEIAGEKAELIGFTADLYASKKVNEYYIYSTSYKDKELKTKAFSDEDFEELTDMDIAEMTKSHNRMTNRFSALNLKRVSLSPFFMNHFYLCDDNPLNFFGKPIVGLTFNQCDLFSYGKYFKHILSEMKNPPSDDMMDDPDKLIELFNVGKNAEKILEKSAGKEGAATTVVGATKEDLERMGISKTTQEGENVVNLNEVAAKKGGNLNMEDLIKLHGV